MSKSKEQKRVKGKREFEVPLAVSFRILKKAGAKLVAESACKTLSKHLEEYGVIIGKIAVSLARHAGRSVVRADDLEVALKEFNEIFKDKFEDYVGYSLKQKLSGKK